jgi:HrpA-like RNA helicase
MKYLDLPVYKHKELIIKALKTHKTVVVESPTGSGKTTQLPVILYDAGFAKNGIIGVTQPRRIAVLSVSEFIARQTGGKRREFAKHFDKFFIVSRHNGRREFIVFVLPN